MSVDHIVLDHNAGVHKQFNPTCHICMWNRDHPVLLQVERKVDDLAEEIADLDTTPECNCEHDCEVSQSDLGEIEGDVDSLRQRVEDLEAGKGLEHIENELTALRSALGEATDILVTLTQRFAELEARP